MIRPVLTWGGVSLLLLLFSGLGVLGCGESRPYYYQYSGTLLKSDGSPAAGAKLFVTDAEGLRQHQTDDSRWNGWRYSGADISAGGQFTGLFNSSEEAPYRWLDLLPIPRPARKLDGVYVFYSLRHCEWESVFVRLDEKAQAHGFPGGRELDLNTIVLPRPSGSPPGAAPK